MKKITTKVHNKKDFICRCCNCDITFLHHINDFVVECPGCHLNQIVADIECKCGRKAFFTMMDPKNLYCPYCGFIFE